MADERKEQMREMFSQGMNYSEIGKKFGISRQRVYQLIGGSYRNNFRAIKPEACVYVEIRKFLNENHISINKFTRMVFGCYENRYRKNLCNLLKGEDGFKSVIDKVLVATGLTYEQAFKRSDAE